MVISFFGVWIGFKLLCVLGIAWQLNLQDIPRRRGNLSQAVAANTQAAAPISIDETCASLATEMENSKF
jgi:hypothetical protein